MKPWKMSFYGFITALLLSVANLLQILWFVWLTVEQVKTGFGFGTNMDIMAIMPMFTAVVSIPFGVNAAVYLVMCLRKKSEKWVTILNAVLFAALIAQIGLIQLFIWY